MIEKGVSLAIISEPPFNLLSSSTCFMSSDSTAGILWRPESDENWKCRHLDCGKGFVTVKFSNVNIVSCYNSPNTNINVFARFLDSLNDTVTMLTSLTLICGDFNARSTLWGSPTTNRRGELVEQWSAALDIRLLNVGGAYTCIRPQGSSIVDLSWSSPSLLDRIVSWLVLEDVETLSDHQYVEVIINSLNMQAKKTSNSKRWNFKKLDVELFSETLELLANASIPENLPDEAMRDG